MSESGRRREDGYGVLWVVILVGLLALCGLVLYAADPDTDEAPKAWILGCSLLVGGGLLVEARRDLYEFCKLTGVFALIGTVVCGLVLLASEEESLLLAGATAVLAIGVTVAFLAVYRISHAEEVLPEALAGVFDRSALMEISGVQFGVAHSDLQVPAGGELVVSLHAQNGMDAERTLELRIKPRADIGKGGHLAFQKVAVLELPPGAAGVVSVPVAVHPKARGTYRIGVDARVKGSGGRRMRVYRARPFTRRVSGGMQLLALFAGVLVWGGGINLELQVAKNPDWKNMPVDEPSPAEAKLVYQPDRAVLEGIRNRL